jgi:citrate synthase
VLLADHSYNASTFGARVTASTNADIYGAITSGVATLAGDLHGGAPSKVMTMLEELGLPENAKPYVRALFARADKITSIGNREYKIRDPRAQHLDGANDQEGKMMKRQRVEIRDGQLRSDGYA